jgi:hypothetical protein
MFSGKDVTMEHRKSKRFNTRDLAFAAFIRPNEPVIVGKIMDVSQRGLAVRYLANGRLEEGSAEVRIFGPNLKATDKIECKIVYDQILSEESWDIFLVRRCGVKFRRIASVDSAKLRTLMRGSRDFMKAPMPLNSIQEARAAL